STDQFRFEGQGQQTNNVRIEGNCTVQGVPYTVPAKVTIDTDGLTASVQFELTGTMPSIGMQCKIPGVGSGYGMSMPVPMNSAKSPPITLPLKDGAEFKYDQSESEAAKIAARGGVTMSGPGIIRIVCHKR